MLSQSERWPQLGKGEAWEPVARIGPPFYNPLVGSYLIFTMEEQKSTGVPVKQADPLLVPILTQMLRDMRSWAHAASSLEERIVYRSPGMSPSVFVIIRPRQYAYDAATTFPLLEGRRCVT